MAQLIVVKVFWPTAAWRGSAITVAPTQGLRLCGSECGSRRWYSGSQSPHLGFTCRNEAQWRFTWGARNPWSEHRKKKAAHREDVVGCLQTACSPRCVTETWRTHVMAGAFRYFWWCWGTFFPWAGAVAVSSAQVAGCSSRSRCSLGSTQPGTATETQDRTDHTVWSLCPSPRPTEQLLCMEKAGRAGGCLTSQLWQRNRGSGRGRETLEVLEWCSQNWERSTRRVWESSDTYPNGDAWRITVSFGFTT